MPFINRIRLAFTIGRPQYPEEREQFRKANGETKTLNAIVRKTYDGTTDWWPEKWHERFKMALAHDHVDIEGERYIGGVTQEGGYEIEWPDFLNYPLGRGVFKLNVSPFNATNNNCASCEEFNQVVAEDDFIGTIGEDETVLVPILYNDSICCSPFEITLVTFNTDYVAAASIVGNAIELTTKTEIATQNNVVLATYRVQCEDGMFDEANIIANTVGGAPAQCLAPEDIFVDTITSNGAGFGIIPPTPAPADGYEWQLFLASDLINPVQTGSTTGTFIDLFGLGPNTNYVLYVRSVCSEGEFSPYIQEPFMTTGGGGGEDTCGNYFVQPVFPETALVNYENCAGNSASVNVGPSGRFICARQTAPGSPIQISSASDLTITYHGFC